ncbi:hypothetical protein NVV93_00365 [Pseudomonas sp. LS44]|uniref:hypothetical protein n=1 Tax=Pseudomonas sp. LS44 TaxID=1357074 RepID=UPI00215AC522|nr:hypothetical protein [Pseudomonas sp. LS44]UVE17889.1 hypothetical protein NVV93_00365 [Pseudomonas sp. LS44]
MPDLPYFSRIGGIASLLGVLLLFVATLLHPMQTPPWDAPAAFAEYAADRHWVGSHLGQLLGVLLGVIGLAALTARLCDGRAGVWALLGLLLATVSLALAFALQAVDGVALKLMVSRWHDASEASQALVFEAAYGVRQIEAGLASLMGIGFGITILFYGVALCLSARAPTWLGLSGLLAGAAVLASSLVQAHTGFSALAMNSSMPSSLLLMLWQIAVGVYLLRAGQEKVM